MTATVTETHTLTREEEAVLAAVEVRRSGRPGRWTLSQIREHVHSNAEASELVDVDDDLIAVVLGQLIERALVARALGDRERYAKAYVRA